jgi:hypothetical protein
MILQYFEFLDPDPHRNTDLDPDPGIQNGALILKKGNFNHVQNTSPVHA